MEGVGLMVVIPETPAPETMGTTSYQLLEEWLPKFYELGLWYLGLLTVLVGVLLVIAFLLGKDTGK